MEKDLEVKFPNIDWGVVESIEQHDGYKRIVTSFGGSVFDLVLPEHGVKQGEPIGADRAVLRALEDAIQ